MDATCSICIENVDLTKGHDKLNPCGHIFHIQCIAQVCAHDAIKGEHKKCPNCRRAFLTVSRINAVQTIRVSDIQARERAKERDKKKAQNEIDKDFIKAQKNYIGIRKQTESLKARTARLNAQIRKQNLDVDSLSKKAEHARRIYEMELAKKQARDAARQ